MRSLQRAGVNPIDVDTVITGSMAQANFDASMTPRHIALCSGCAIETPAREKF